MVVFAAVACSEGDPQSLTTPNDFAEGLVADVPVAVERPNRDEPATSLDSRPPVFADEAPPPITGGTIAASRDGSRALIADPDRDQLWMLALPSGSILARHDLEADVEPGRVTEDERGYFHVALRRAGKVLSLTRDGEIELSRSVCAAPRGLAADDGSLHVACAEGLLVTLPTAGGPATRILELEPDLRDVVIDEVTGDLVVSLFRSAEVLFLDADGSVVARRVPPMHSNRSGDRFAPTVAWRMRAAPGGGVLLLHQRSQTTALSLDTGDAGYEGTECSVGVVQSAMTRLSRDGAPTQSPTITGVALAVDFDVAGDTAVVIAPGVLDTPRAGVVMRSRHQVRYLDVDDATSPGGPGACVTGPSSMGEFEAQLSSVAALPEGQWLYQGREPSVVVRDGDVVTTMPTGSVADDGHAFFHMSPGVAIACASCHPEGGDDGHTWQFAGLGPRRTQTLRGPILDSAPFHWGGDVPTFDVLAHSTIEQRMGGPAMHGMFVEGMARFVESIPHLPRAVPEDPDAVERGAAIFASAETGCTDCHRGERLSDDLTVDVGTGGLFQTPGLRGLRYRAPYMHDGCAETLHDVFGACRGDLHGDVDHLSGAELDDLVAFLGSL
jgi:hypothetical protein